MDDSTIFLIYMSRSVDKTNKIDLVDICAKAAAKNKLLNITGLLLCIGNTFIQVLEGKKDIVHNLYDKIQLDSRHIECRILYEGATSSRIFGQWSMNFINMDDEYFLKLEEFQTLRALVNKILLSPESRLDNFLKLIQKIPKVLKTHRIELQDC